MTIEINANGTEFDNYSWGALINNGANGLSDFYTFKEKSANDFTNKVIKF